MLPVTLNSSVETTTQKAEKRLRIAYLTMNDANDRRSWSGTHYYMARALERHCGHVSCVGPLRPFSSRLGRAIQLGVHRLTGRTYLYSHTRSLSKTVATMADKRLSSMEPDLIFAPAGSVPIAGLRTPSMIVYSSDATLQQMIDYYPEFTGVFASHIRQAHEIERLAIQKSRLLIYPSTWAARSAVQDYGADPSKVSIVPFGANIEVPPSRAEALGMPRRNPCRLLFVGVDWLRKGGDIAVETLIELERLGVRAELTIVGCRPPDGTSHPHVEVIPFVNKNDPAGEARLASLYHRSDFFLLPTRAECFGIAVCEANAYGLPVLTTDTGGISELVRDGITGFVLPLAARGDQYATRIRDIYKNPALHKAMRVSSRDEFESRLNWDVWGERVGEILRSAMWQLPLKSRNDATL